MNEVSLSNSLGNILAVVTTIDLTAPLPKLIELVHLAPEVANTLSFVQQFQQCLR